MSERNSNRGIRKDREHVEPAQSEASAQEMRPDTGMLTGNSSSVGRQSAPQMMMQDLA